MARHLFDAGTLFATPALRPALSRQSVGAPLAATYPVTNGVDGKPLTLVDLPTTSSARTTYLVADLGRYVTIDHVQLLHFSEGAEDNVNTGVTVYVSKAPIPGTDFTGATALTGPNFSTGFPENSDFTFTAAPGLIGRYITVVIRGDQTQACRFGEIVITPVANSIEFGSVQKTALDTSYQPSELFIASHLSRQAIDVAHTGGQISLQATYVRIRPGALALVLGCTQSGVDPVTLQPITGSVRLPELSGVFEGRDTKNKRFRFQANRLIAPGSKIDFALGQFTTGDVTFTAYMDDTNIVARFLFEN